MKMLSVGGAGSIRRPSVAGEGNMEGLRFKRPSEAGDRDMEGLRFKRPSVAGDRDMGGLRIKRPSLAGDRNMEGLWINRPSLAGDRDMEGLGFICSDDTARRKERRKKLLKEGKGRKRKTLPPSMESLLSHELTNYMLYEPERRPLELDPDFEVDRFFPDPVLAAKAIASLKKSSETWADSFRQFRLNGHATVFPELTGDEKEE